MILQGKGFFTFILPECEGGDPASIVNAAKSAGLSHVLVKIADGTFPFGLTGAIDHTAPVVSALQEAGIAVWGWHYVYGNEPSGEAAIAIKRTKELSLNGYVIDAEAEYKNKHAAARAYINALRTGLPSTPLALSSFRFPQLHPELPWEIFLEKCDYHMPQVYWEQSHNAGAQLRESKKQCDALPNAKPYIATAPTYNVPGWDPTPADITDFLNTAKALNISAVNFFSWDFCRKNLPALWGTISNFEWLFTPSIPVSTTPASDLAAKYLSALNARNLSALSALYADTALRVSADKISRNKTDVTISLGGMINQLPAGTSIAAKVDIANDLLRIQWKAGALSAVQTLLVASGKIRADYMFTK